MLDNGKFLSPMSIHSILYKVFFTFKLFFPAFAYLFFLSTLSILPILSILSTLSILSIFSTIVYEKVLPASHRQETKMTFTTASRVYSHHLIQRTGDCIPIPPIL